MPAPHAPVPLPAPSSHPWWPHRALDVAGLRRAGVRPVPFRQFVLKVHSRCNLACTYCYVYRGADQSWRERPPRVPEPVVAHTARRIAEHAAGHGLTAVHLNFHGGEPLLAGAGFLAEAAATVRAAVRDRAPGCAVHVSLQTNATLLTDRALAALAAADVRVGVSLDGGDAALNGRRVTHTGRPAWPAAARGLRRLTARPGTWAGVLCTIDPRSDPVRVYESLAALRPPSLDLLLPHANWSSPPPGRGPAEEATRYGDWLITAFDHWFARRPAGPPVRIFREIIGLLLGVPGGAEAVGTSPLVAVVVDTDGAIEQVDSLKTAYEGAPATGLDVFRHSFDEALDHPGIAARQLGPDALPDACRACPVVAVCGGGNYAHRYRAENGFRNRSVYCADLYKLVGHVAGRIAEATSAPGL
ncbi:FxsB family cyclophane-forming radical SAM/SPASM peptide maturase [Streptomyces sp. NPDC018347]|uniref:FxsB family cyclophane-forming radical SAM/SPASM peptide maturase n=1 Tax=Streptomyces sp. NPDC018347 TaxID=3157193 RepID=UPI0033E67933